jgi:periplasmic copper chaperone A
MTSFTLTAKLRGVAAATAALILPVILTQIAAVPAQAADYNVGSIHITDPWSRATPKGAAAGAAYMTVTNNGSAPDRVSCVSSEASAECQIHSMTMEDGIMKMRPVQGGLEIKPGETVMLKPGGFHMMLLNLKHPLDAGQTLKATLKFDHAGTVDVDFPIAGIGAPAPGGAANSGGGSMMMQGGSMQGGSMQGGSMQGGSMQGGSMKMQGPSGGAMQNKQ